MQALVSRSLARKLKFFVSLFPVAHLLKRTKTTTLLTKSITVPALLIYTGKVQQRWTTFRYLGFPL